MTPPTVKRIKKGQLVFGEGESSRSMYILKRGMVRIFKKKGNSVIELDTIRQGQILGELAFLDGNPRSASGEGLTDCELIEVDTALFTATIKNIPDWLKLLLKTVVGRLRAASTRIKQLETANTSFEYSPSGGRARSGNFVFINTQDLLKLSTSMLVVASHYGEKQGSGSLTVRPGLLNRYANQILGVPVSKITTFLDVLSQTEVVTVPNEGQNSILLKDAAFLESLIQYVNEQNLADERKRHLVSRKMFAGMESINKYLDRFESEDGQMRVNLVNILDWEMESTGSEPFKMEDVSPMVKMEWLSELQFINRDEIYTSFDVKHFTHMYKVHRVLKAIEDLNEEKGADSTRR